MGFSIDRGWESVECFANKPRESLEYSKVDGGGGEFDVFSDRCTESQSLAQGNGYVYMCRVGRGVEGGGEAGCLVVFVHATCY